MRVVCVAEEKRSKRPYPHSITDLGNLPFNVRRHKLRIGPWRHAAGSQSNGRLSPAMRWTFAQKSSPPPHGARPCCAPIRQRPPDALPVPCAGESSGFCPQTAAPQFRGSFMQRQPLGLAVLSGFVNQRQSGCHTGRGRQSYSAMRCSSTAAPCFDHILGQKHQTSLQHCAPARTASIGLARHAGRGPMRQFLHAFAHARLVEAGRRGPDRGSFPH